MYVYIHTYIERDVCIYIYIYTYIYIYAWLLLRAGLSSCLTSEGGHGARVPFESLICPFTLQVK